MNPLPMKGLMGNSVDSDSGIENLIEIYTQKTQNKINKVWGE